MKRILTAIVGLPILLLTIWSSIPHFFVVLSSLATLIALHEFYGIAGKVGCRPARQIGYTAAIMLIACFFLDESALIAGVLAAVVMLALGSTLATRVAVQSALNSAAATVFGIMYIPLLTGFLVGVRMLNDGATTIPVAHLAAKLITMFFAIVFMTDTAAYYCGRALGRHKLAPRISPGKTIEGSIGGLIGAVLAGLVSRMTFFPEIPLIDAMLLGAAIGILGQLGDLAESMLKRGADVKDSGTLLPGHGGMLDRIDSILFSAPLLYYYSRYFVSTH
jgi:phosphatidate cytidylyltransferase